MEEFLCSAHFVVRSPNERFGKALVVHHAGDAVGVDELMADDLLYVDPASADPGRLVSDVQIYDPLDEKR